MSIKNCTVHGLTDDLNHDQIALDRYLKQVKRYTDALRILMSLALLVAVGAIGMALFTLRDTYPFFVKKVVFIAQSGILLIAMFLISNWLRIWFQHKIDQSNAQWYGHNWSE